MIEVNGLAPFVSRSITLIHSTSKETLILINKTTYDHKK